MERNQLVVDFASYTPYIYTPELIEGGVVSGIIKSSSDTREAQYFQDNMTRMIDGGLIPQIYHWLDPIGNWRDEANFLVDLVKQWPQTKFVWLDLEQWWDNWGTWYQAIQRKIEWAAVGKFSDLNISRNAHNILTEVASKTGIGVGVYSSQSFIRQYAPSCNQWLGEYPFWTAHYGHQPNQQTTLSWDILVRGWLPIEYEPLIPLGVDREKLVGHQFTGDRFRLPGLYYDDTRAKRVMADVNVFNKEFLESISGSDVGYIPPEIPPGDEKEEPMTIWSKFPKGRSIQVHQSPANINYGDFAIVSLGNGYESEDINDMLKAQVIEAHAQGVPAIGIFRPVFAEYTTRKEGPNQGDWNSSADPWITKQWYPYYLDRLIAQGVDAVMLDPVFKEGSSVIKTSWAIECIEYYVRVLKEKGLKTWFLFMRRADFLKLEENQEGTEWTDFMEGFVGSTCEYQAVDAKDGYPTDESNPYFHAPKVDFWNFQGNEWLYCNDGGKAGLYGALNFESSVTPTDPPIEPPIEEPPVTEPPAPSSNVVEKFAHAVMLGAKAAVEFYFEE